MRARAHIAPEEIRARNFVKPRRCPITPIPIATYDVGEFEGAMRACLAKADHAGFGARAEAAKTRGLIRGIGISSYIECTAWGDGEEGSVELGATAISPCYIGTQSNGQGHETAYAQVVSQYLDVPLERIKVVQGDTDRFRPATAPAVRARFRSARSWSPALRRRSSPRSRNWRPTSSRRRSAILKSPTAQIRIAGTDRAISYEEIAELARARSRDKLKAIEVVHAA